MAVVGAHTPQVKQCQPRFYLTHGTPVRLYRYSSPSLRHLAWCLRLIASNDHHPTFISIFLDMLFTNFIVTLALLSVGYAQPVPSCECFGFRNLGRGS